MKSKLILIGGGGHCRSCIDVIESTQQYLIHGILDPNLKENDTVLNYPILGNDELIVEYTKKNFSFLITLGQIKSASIRKKIFEKLVFYNSKIATIISNRAYVSQHATINEGTIVMHDALVNANAWIGKNCIINTKALIEHDVRVHDHCHISTGAIVNGGVTIHDETFYGSSSVSKEYVSISANSFIKANSTIKENQ